MVSTRKKRNQQKKQLSQLNETLNDFITGNGTNVSAMENETLEQLTIGQHNDFERFVDSASQNQVIEIIIDDKVRKAVDNAVLTVGNRMHDGLSTGMDTVVIPRVDMAVKSITGSSGHGLNSEVQSPDRRNFSENAGNTPLISASSRLDFNTNQDRNAETLNEKKFRGWQLSGIKA